MTRKSIFAGVFVFLIGATSLFSAAGKVYLVLASDTAIWDGMDVAEFNCTYNASLYTDPNQNCYKVMNTAFREKYKDSFGQPVKMTWYMMGGNIFRYATNKNFPIPNTMTIYLMNKYHGEAVRQTGDELSIHYHTFAWTDYDGDGKWYWNQALDFNECRDDFDFTLCQYLLEEETFPVSFRSGWHYMDNNWQHYLNQITPYTLHNDYPADRIDTVEPLDNTYHWGQASSKWTAYRPSDENYQLPGNGAGFIVRSRHFNSFNANGLLDQIFAEADKGTDQIACIWGHLPETDFLTNIEKIDSLAHLAAEKYPNVKFAYCTGTEALQKYRNTSDFTAPVLTFESETVGDSVYLAVRTDEPIFQCVPYIAAKDVYENYFVVPCELNGTNEWRSTKAVNRNFIAKVGTVVCDTLGNQSMKFINFRPDDIYIDNLENGYTEIRGSWAQSAKTSWGTDSRIATVAIGDTALVRWTPEIIRQSDYNVFIQMPAIDNPVDSFTVRIFTDGVCTRTEIVHPPIQQNQWMYVGSATFSPSQNNYIEIEAIGTVATGKQFAADVMKISGLIRDRDMVLNTPTINFGEVSQSTPYVYQLVIQNAGASILSVGPVFNFKKDLIRNKTIIELPVQVPPMSYVTIPLDLDFTILGTVIDTLVIHSDDPYEPVCEIPVMAEVQRFFMSIDNEDTANYSENRSWHYSTAWAYGPTSRYSWLSDNNRASATFKIVLPEAGLYNILEIVPTTVNAATNAGYITKIDGVAIDTVFLNQNTGSGDWVKIATYQLPAEKLIEVVVIDLGGSTGSVLRADAIKWQMTTETGIANVSKPVIPERLELEQNYPNPFNASTRFNYSVAKPGNVEIKLYDLIGREVATLVRKYQPAGFYSVVWNAGNVSSGVYVCVLRNNSEVRLRKMLIVK
ncbi:MAG: T9SS type A sorting domain-containing protein [Candidatus Neomarinimicrobiota bacterium]